MASNFELGDEQPENPPARRKPFKPSGTMIRRKISVQWLPKEMRVFKTMFNLARFYKIEIVQIFRPAA